MSDSDKLKADIKKLSAKAINAKMNLHDLSEDIADQLAQHHDGRAGGLRCVQGPRRSPSILEGGGGPGRLTGLRARPRTLQASMIQR